MSGRWEIFTRDANLGRGGQVETFSKLSIIARFNAVGSWVLDLDYGSPAAARLVTPGAGIVVTLNGVTVLSGPVTNRERKFADRSNRLVVAGPDDSVHLARRLAHPQPLTAAPPYSTTAYDVRTGAASTVLRQYVDVNAGPSAVTPRRVPGLTLGVDPLTGSTLTGRARWQNLLTVLQELAIAGGGLGFEIDQVGAGLELRVFQPTDRTATVRFAPDFGNIAAFDYTVAAAAANYVYGAGSGEGTARVIREGQNATSVIDWSRIELFRDRRDTADTAELDQSIAEELTSSAAKADLMITPIDIPNLTFGTHYNLGDRVTVVVDGASVAEVVREVHVDITDEAGVNVRPKVGGASSEGLLAVFGEVARLRARVADLERR